MKKLVAFTLCLMLACAVLASFPALSVNAEADYETPVWQMVQIPLKGSVKYKNPYAEIEIDAVFTHEDGTTITVPGFWNGNYDWAVRFAPTKTGRWQYRITCTDETNTGLHGQTGTVNAVAYTGDNPNMKHGFLKIDGRHFVYDDGTPFFWLGDTNWQAPQTLSNEKCNYPGCNCGSQMDHIINDRAAKGFTVFQTYFSATGSNSVQGNTSYWKTACNRVRVETFNDRIDHLFAKAAESGMVIAMGFGCHSSTMQVMQEADYHRLIRYCVARYGCYNLVWITGQEITNTEASRPNNGKEVMSVYMDGAKLTEELDGYKHPNGAHMYPMYYNDTRSQRLENSTWHDWWTLQSGHGASIQGKAFYKSYYTSLKKKPYVEAEANYEEINCGGFTGYDASRYSAWNAILNGCCGFTYGATGVWAASYSNSVYTGWYGATTSYSYEPWYIGVTKPGSYEVGYMREFFELLPDWSQLIPRFDDIAYADFAVIAKKLIASTEDGKTAVCYFRNSDVRTGTIYRLDGTKDYRGLWFDTRTGAFLEPVELEVSSNGVCELPQKPDKQDWALIVTCEPLKNSYRVEKAFENASACRAEVTGDKMKPVSVTAIGGIFYSGQDQVMTDPTDNLFDGDPATVWKPLSERTTQTFLMDLGKPYELSGLTVTPTADTVLPRHYRVEVSNDGTNWKRVIESEVRGDKEENTGISDQLSGGWRFVKLVLMNPISMSQSDALRKKYKTMNNGSQAYSCTEIADMALYVSGEATNIEEVRIVTEEPAEEENENGGEGISDKTVWLTAILCGGAVLLSAAAVTAISLIKKKKNAPQP